MAEDLYKNYVKFKTWDEPFIPAHQDFVDLLNRAAVTGAGLRILEIGCGAGRFLKWARSQGHDIQGTELIPELVERLRLEGFTVHQSPISEADFAPEMFDAIVAIDVFEHLGFDDLTAMLSLARGILKPSGRLIAQFPNGASPFSGKFQSGDWTHGKPLSPSSLRQIAQPVGMEVIAAFNPRSIPPGVVKGLKRRTVYLCRDLIENVIGLLYFGQRIPLDPNVMVVLAPATAK